MEALRSMAPSDPNYVAQAQTQKNIKDNLKTAEDSLFSLSKRIPQIQSTVNREITAINTQIDNALENLGERRTTEANRNQQYAMTSMNNLALMLSDALSQLQDKMSQKSGKGKKGKQMSVKQLRQMQEKLSQNMQKAREQMQKEGDGPKGQSQQQRGQMSEQLAKMAREQQMIRQQLQQLDNEESKNGGAGVKDADKISQQMEQIEKDIVNRKITDEALNRQKDIHTRLLEAEKAEQEREQDVELSFGEERGCESGDVVDRTGVRASAMLRDQQPGQREVVELAQVAGVVGCRQAAFPGPVTGFGQPGLSDPDPGSQRRDGAHVREEAAHVSRLGL